MQDADDKWSRQRPGNQQGIGDVDYAGWEITKVEARLNRIRVFGRYDYSDLERLGDLEYDENNLSKSPNYLLKVIRRPNGSPDFYLSVTVNPKAFSPQCSIEIRPNKDIGIGTYKTFLIKLHQSLPDLMVSKAEYAVDQFCTDPDGASLLFWVYIRCLHLGYHKKAKMPGVDGRRPEERKKGLIYEIDRHHKVYECGREERRQDGGWLISDIDRVRLEHRVDRDKLKEYGISALEDLIENPRFTVLNLQRWRFMQFLKLRKLPKFWRPHPTADDAHPIGAPTLEAIPTKQKSGNVTQYIANYKELIRIESRVNRAMKAFDFQWYNVK
ncbi:hypothetical protein PITCH_A1670015 [uncultured Desulfobacterium sp.]|uniref:Uncharacterized protein n=1 Tax=uncultured Desulfobacterium sp. TaxID=201089 RepID=A0A445MUJ2_9BACT|nr:hypothetical protein PITCH_A1670015 [uncultured Desulfobacterium sp.]